MAGKYDQFLVGVSSGAPSGPSSDNAPVRNTGKYDRFLAGLDVEKKLPESAQTNEESAFKRFGGVLPVAGSIAGGLLGAGAGAVTGPGAIASAVGGAGLGAATGEAARQHLGRILGEDVPMSGGEAAKEIAKETGYGAVGELTGIGLGRLASRGFKAFPKVGQAFSGTPATNIARAQQRGYKVFTPGVSRKAAGEMQGQAEEELMRTLFKPEEKISIDLNKKGFANKLIEDVALKIEKGKKISPKEALGVRRAIQSVYPPETAKGSVLGARLTKIGKEAKAALAEYFPDLTKKISQTEKAITASQLRIPLRVNRTNPNQISGLATTLGAFRPVALAGTVPFSPLSMGLVGATMGQVKKSIPKGVRRAIQRSGTQSLVRALGGLTE